MPWHWFRKHETHPCQIVFIPFDGEFLGEVWCNTHTEFYRTSHDDLALVKFGREHVAQFEGKPNKVFT